MPKPPAREFPDATFNMATAILETIAKSSERRLIDDDRAKEAKDRYSESLPAGQAGERVRYS
ncbi:MAG: hypothetical protein KDB00_21780 [Planctomycetales bacterium]|nr:hypothetical protein [Planctomycetales bacterium]